MRGQIPGGLATRKVVWGVARKTIIVSDLTGKEIEAKEAARVTITYADARRGQVVLDVNAEEVADLARKARDRRVGDDDRRRSPRLRSGADPVRRVSRARRLWGVSTPPGTVGSLHRAAEPREAQR
jgi:hypothetical protein